MLHRLVGGYRSPPIGARIANMARSLEAWRGFRASESSVTINTSEAPKTVSFEGNASSLSRCVASAGSTPYEAVGLEDIHVVDDEQLVARGQLVEAARSRWVWISVVFVTSRSGTSRPRHADQ